VKLRRAIFIYVGTIVLPVCGLLWLGVQSFERQREALATLQGEKLTAEVTRREEAAAEAALRDSKGPVVRHFFRVERGRVVWPALTAPLPDPLPASFRDADLQEANHPDVALDIYRKLFASGQNPALALSRIARCLDKLGMRQEARAVWRKLTSTYPNERDLAHRPYGIVAAIAAGETSGLYEQITAGRWELPAEQAEHFLAELDPDRTTPYLEQFRFARALQDGFHPQAALRDDQLYSYALGEYRVYFRSAAERIEGLIPDAEMPMFDPPVDVQPPCVWIPMTTPVGSWIEGAPEVPGCASVR